MTSRDDDEMKNELVLRLFDDLSLIKIWNDLMHDFLSYDGNKNDAERNNESDFQ